MKRKMMMLIATVVMVAGLTACGSTDTSTGKPMDTDKGIENGVAVDPTESTEPVESEPAVEETTPVVEEEPTYTEFEIRDYDYYVYFSTVDGEVMDLDKKIVDVAFRVPEGYEVTWDDVMSVKDRLYRNGRYHEGGFIEGLVIAYAECPGSEGWSYYEEAYYSCVTDVMAYIYDISGEEAKERFALNLTAEEFQALYVEFINNYSIQDMLDLYYNKGCEITKGDSMSDEAKKFLPIVAIIDGIQYTPNNGYADYISDFLNNPENYTPGNTNYNEWGEFYENRIIYK